ncbi:MAG: hypothetical protein IKO91_00395 [Oscillospiraceae bacterium]|nr:hypothetical protein [Oscillospiraceae bacterium]
MKALLWVGGILLLLVLLLCLRVRVTALYGEEGPSLTVALGALRLARLPGRKRPAAAKEKKKPRKKEKKQTEETLERPGPEPGFRDLVPIITKVLGKLKRRLGVDELTLWYVSAGDDPAMAALLFGAANAAAEALLRPLKERLRIRKLDVRTSVSFSETKPRVLVRLRFSLALGALLWIALGAYRQYRALCRPGGTKAQAAE